jgi:HPr kinase/phosphorylase
MMSRHGVLLSIDDCGVLIVGRSGIGKSELALELLDRGHCLVADDAPLLSRTGPDTISGRCPEVLQDFLSVYGFGILNIRHLYGEHAVKASQQLDLIIHLIDPCTFSSAPDNKAVAVLNGFRRLRRVLGVNIPELTIIVNGSRDLSLWIECAVRDLQLRHQGYVAEQDLQQRLTQAIARQTA